MTIICLLYPLIRLWTYSDTVPQPHIAFRVTHYMTSYIYLYMIGIIYIFNHLRQYIYIPQNIA